MSLTSRLKSSTAEILDLSDFEDVLGQLGDAPDVPSVGLRYVVHAQPMSHSLQEANIDKYIPGLAVGNYAVPKLDGGYELFSGDVGIRYMVAQTRQVHVKHLADGSTEMLPKLINRDLFERVIDDKTGFKISRLRDTKERVETQWHIHGLFDGQHPATRRYKGSNYKTGQAVNNIVSRNYLGDKFCPMLTLFHEKSRFVQGAQGPRYEAEVKPLGRLGELGGPPREWFRRAVGLRISLLGGAPFQASEAFEAGPPPPPAIESNITPGEIDVRSGDRSTPFGGPGPDDEIIPF
jgi:hypothetical protein